MADKAGKTPPLVVVCKTCGTENMVPKKAIMHAAGAIINSFRKHKRGKERVIYKCRCGKLFSAREFRDHETKCDVAPARAEVLAHPERFKASAKERDLYLTEKGLKVNAG